ncbi:uncharacterized protein LODBEIA_P14240 [Lodderomyces beijingensis]|uniref:Uncharacterized protein n=1 Tax=Lodderomyces beijingensis TaxID=1775926 RepID=A0ABP0ZLP2_9ASCO
MDSTYQGYSSQATNLWLLACLLYIWIFLVSVPLSLFLTQYSSSIAQLWFVKFLEKYVVRGWIIIWFTLLYIVNLATDNRKLSFDIKNPKTLRCVKIYIANFVWLTILLEWCLGPPLFERVSVWSGAHCTVPQVSGEYACQRAGGNWINPFDSSSHYTMLLSCSLLVWDLVIPYLPSYAIYRKFGTMLETRENSAAAAAAAVEPDLEMNGWAETNDSKISDYKKIVVLVSLIFISLWLISYCTTSLFFHTIPEKLVGLICGLFIPLLSHTIPLRS